MCGRWFEPSGFIWLKDILIWTLKITSNRLDSSAVNEYWKLKPFTKRKNFHSNAHTHKREIWIFKSRPQYLPFPSFSISLLIHCFNISMNIRLRFVSTIIYIVERFATGNRESLINFLIFTKVSTHKVVARCIIFHLRIV